MNKKALVVVSLLATVGIVGVASGCDNQTVPPENHAPVIAVVPDSIGINAGEAIELLYGVTAYDEEDGELTSNVFILDDDDFDEDVPGTYTIIYKVTDSDGESSTATRTVTVEQALSALTLEVRKNLLGETKWQGNTINFKNSLYHEISADTAYTVAESGVWHNTGSGEIVLDMEGSYGCSAVLTANGVVIEGRDGANNKLVDESNPTRAGSSASTITVGGENVSVSTAFAKQLKIPAGGYAVIVQSNYAGSTADTDGRGFINYNVIYSWGNVVRLLWADDNTVLTPYVNQAPEVSGNTTIYANRGDMNFNVETVVKDGLTLTDDNGTFDPSDDLTLTAENVNIISDGGFDINTVGEYTFSLTVTDGTLVTYFTRVVSVDSSDNFTELAIGDNTFIALNEAVAVDQDVSSIGNYSLLIYTPAYKGEISYSNGYGEAFILSAYGQIVRIYDGANAKYYDEANKNGVQDSSKCTAAGYVTEAFQSLQEGEYLIVAPNSTVNNADSGSRKFLLSNRTIGAKVALTGISFAEITYTFTVGEKSFSSVESKTAVNEIVANAALYGMLIYTTDCEEETIVCNGYGAAIVLDRYGRLIKVYDGANVGLYTEEGKAASAGFTASDYAQVAYGALEDGQTLIIFPNDGVNGADSARTFALGLRTDGSIGQFTSLTGFTFETYDEGDNPVTQAVLSIGDKTYNFDPEKIAVDKTTSSATAYELYVFTTAYSGAIGFSNGYGEAFVTDAEGKIVRIYDGANGKYYDAENTAGIQDATKCTSSGYLMEALASLQAGETLFVAPNDDGANAVRAFFYGNRTIGAAISLTGVTVSPSNKTMTSISVNGKYFFNPVVTVNEEATAANCDFAVYSYGYNGVMINNGWCEVFVIDAEGKIVKIYDGVNGKYYDADNPSGVARTDDMFALASVSTDAFKQLQPGERMIIGFNGGLNSNAGRAFLVGNRVYGATVAWSGIEVAAAATEKLTYATVTVNGKTYYQNAVNVVVDAAYTGTPAFAIYHYGYKGTLISGGYGVAYVVDEATGKVVSVYDGASGKYWDADNDGVTGICTAAGYIKEGFDALEEGQYLIVAPNGGTADNAARGLFYSNRKVGISVSYQVLESEEEGTGSEGDQTDGTTEDNS